MMEEKKHALVYTGAVHDATVGDYTALHRKAMQLGIPCLTSLDTARALADSLASRFNAGNTELVDLLHMRSERQRISFTKMQSCGNDCLFIENFDGRITCPEALCVRLCTPHWGIGADGTELYVYKSKGENLTPNGLQPGEQVQAEVFGYYLHTPNETLYTVEYTTEGDKSQNTYSIRTFHIEDLFEVLYLTGADATFGATPVAFTAPAK